MTSKTVSQSGILTNILPMNTKQALTLDPFPILNFKEASKKLMGIKIMQIYEGTKKKNSLWLDGGSAWAWASTEAKSVGWAREMVVGGRRRSSRSVVVVWGVFGAKSGRLQSVAVCGRCRRWLGASPDFELVPWVGVAGVFGGGSG
jgi:hypothetical protein